VAVISEANADNGKRRTRSATSAFIIPWCSVSSPEDQAAMEVEWMISSLGLAVLSVPRSGAVNVWRKADTGMRTDEAHVGHRGLHRDPSAVNTSSQSIHRNASLMFMIFSSDPFHVGFSTLLRQFP
jgi:hypothetical protein